MNKIKLVFISFLAMIFFTININTSMAANVELMTGKLPLQLREGDHVNFSLKINYEEDAKSIIIDTSLIPSGNEPIYNFGDLNPSITENRYNQKITLNTSSLPPKTFQLSISGKSPEGETRIKSDGTDIVISKFSDTKLKYYDVQVDQKLAGIESFDLIISKKENFDKTIGQISWKELDGLKADVKKLFDNGLATDAQKLADDMVKIKVPNSLLLFGIINIDNDLFLDGIIIIIILIVFVIGYVAGSRGSLEDEEI